MPYYFGVDTRKLTHALGDMFDLLEANSTGAHCSYRVAEYKQSVILQKLETAVDGKSFASLLQDAGINRFTNDMGAVLQTHALLKTSDTATECFKVLTSAGLAQTYLRPLDEPLIHEGEIWRGMTYAEKILKMNPLQLKLKQAWHKMKHESDASHTITDDFVADRKRADVLQEMHTRLSALQGFDLYKTCQALAGLCGLKDEGRDLEGRSPLQHYYIKLSGVSADMPPAEAGQKMELQKSIHDAVSAYAEDTSVAMYSYGMEGSLGMSYFSLNVTFRGMHHVAQKIADTFPNEHVMCLETRQRVEPQSGVFLNTVKKPLLRKLP